MAKIRARRGGELLQLDRALLHSPALAAGWNTYLGAVRGQLDLPARLRELAICVVAVLNGAAYEFEHHLPLYLAEGAAPEQAAALREFGQPSFPIGLFSELEQDVLSLTDTLTRQIRAPRPLKRRIAQSIGVQQLVELIGVIATYNMVSRFLVAMEIETEQCRE